MLTLAIVTMTNTEAIAQEQIKLEGKSDKGAFNVDITWTPNSITKVNTFDINFSDPETQAQIEEVKYDFSIYSVEARQMIVQKNNQYATQQEVSFNEPGSYIIRISNIEDLEENISIPIQVTPEFPQLDELIVVYTITLIVVTVLLARLNRNSLFSQQIN